jgi:hypothetical protein
MAAMRYLFSLVLVCSGSGLACDNDSPPVPIIDASFDANLDCSAPTVVEGMPCLVEDQACGGPCTDACSFCNVLLCRNGEWTRLEAVPAPCFACGPDERCVQYSEYCHVTHPDIGGQPDTFECSSMPAACTADPSCACLGSEIAFDACSGDAGQLVIETSGG